jgi:hypothetical protein
MNKREEQRLNELLAKKEAEEKADREFFKQVKKRKDEVLKVLKIETAAAPVQEDPEPNYFETELRRIADLYGCSVYDLLRHIETEKQIKYYKNYISKS